MIELPEKVSVATRKSPKIMVIYGSPKVGKTTAVSQLDNCLIMDLEMGSEFVQALKVNVDSMEAFKDVGKQLAMYKQQHGKNKYKYGAIDTVDILETWCEVEAIKDYKNTAMGKGFTGSSILELSQGAGYYYLRNAVLRFIDIYSNLFDHLILVTHLRDKLITTKSGEEVSAKDISLTGRLASLVCAKADAIGYLYRSEDTLNISFKTSDLISCGSRCEHLGGKTMELKWENIYIDNLK